MVSDTLTVKSGTVLGKNTSDKFSYGIKAKNITVIDGTVLGDGSRGVYTENGGVITMKNGKILATGNGIGRVMLNLDLGLIL